MITALKVSLTRMQYEQLLDTLQFLTTSPTLPDNQEASRSNIRQLSTLADIREEDTGVTTLNMDPHLRAKLFPAVSLPKKENVTNSIVTLKGKCYFLFFFL